MAENALGMVSSAFVKTIHVELPYERVDFVVAEVLWEDYFLKFLYIFDDELCAGWSPIGDFGKLFVLAKCANTLKIRKVLAMKPAT